MVKNRRNKWTVILLIVCMMFSSISFANAAESAKSDVKGHWAESQLNNWLEKGLIKGYADGTVKPDHPVTRAELISLVNRAFGLTEKADVIFSDIQSNYWAYGDVGIAIKADYIKGNSDGTFAPGNKTSRQEVAVIIARLLKLQADSQNAVIFSDADRFASWSKEAIGSVAAKKIMQGYEDQTFKPEAQITRAEAVVTLDRALQALQSQTETQKNAYNAAGTYGPVSGAETINGDVAVNVPGVTLQNMVINGNLLLAEGIGSGDAFLKNVTVKGTTTVQGGGDHSIHFENGIFGKVIVDKKDGTVRLVLEGTTIIEQLDIKSPVNLELGKDSNIGTLIIDALLKTLGQGTIEKAIIGDEGKGSTFEKQPQKLEGPGATTTPTAGGGGGMGSGNGPTTITSVTTSTAIAEIKVDNGTKLLSVLSGLPTTVQITLSDGTTPIVNVTWNGGTPAYNGYKGGTYAFSGTLSVPGGVSNPSNIQAKANVIVANALPQLVSTTIVTDVVSSFSNIQISNGTSLLSVLNGLPTTMQIKLSDGTNPTVNINWDGGSPVYDGNKDGIYVFSGTPIIPSDVSNPSNVQAKINVIVANVLPGPVSTTIVSNGVSAISDIQVPNSTSLLSVLSGLPTTVQITLSDGTNPTVNVTWNGGTPAYNGYKGGTYAFSGTLAVPGGVSNPSNVQAKANVIVANGLPQLVSTIIVTDVVSSFSNIQISNGTSLLSVLNGLPTTMQIKLSDGTNPTVNINWDGGSPVYDGNKDGIYEFSGTPIIPSDVSNPSNVQAKINVIIGPMP
ncbi:Ig-like domain-containing protein [Cohnella suwonensis]|uniref:Ig-like domain-containing protein n=1 Tax=Cohnella suwonensis TaxID=696072 RepID=A0ABW0LZ13_9BACL